MIKLSETRVREDPSFAAATEKECDNFWRGFSSLNNTEEYPVEDDPAAPEQLALDARLRDMSDNR